MFWIYPECGNETYYKKHVTKSFEQKRCLKYNEYSDEVLKLLKEAQTTLGFKDFNIRKQTILKISEFIKDNNIDDYIYKQQRLGNW